MFVRSEICQDLSLIDMAPYMFNGPLKAVAYRQCSMDGMVRYPLCLEGIERFGMPWYGMIWCSMPLAPPVSGETFKVLIHNLRYCD